MAAGIVPSWGGVCFGLRFAGCPLLRSCSPSAVAALPPLIACWPMQARHLQHPQFCLDAVLYGVQNGGLAGLQKVGVGGGLGRPFPLRCFALQWSAVPICAVVVPHDAQR